MFRWCLQVFLSKWAVPGLFFFIIVLFFSTMYYIKSCWWLDSNWVDIWYRKRPLYQLPHNHCQVYMSHFWLTLFLFLKKWAKPDLFFCLFSFLSHITWTKYSTNFTINEKSVDGMLGSRTRGGRFEGADESTELRRHPNIISLRTSIMQLAPYLNVGLGTS